MIERFAEIFVFVGFIGHFSDLLSRIIICMIWRYILIIYHFIKKYKSFICFFCKKRKKYHLENKDTPFIRAAKSSAAVRKSRRAAEHGAVSLLLSTHCIICYFLLQQPEPQHPWKYDEIKLKSDEKSKLLKHIDYPPWTIMICVWSFIARPSLNIFIIQWFFRKIKL